MPEYIERGAAKHAADLAFDMTETEYDMICKELDRVPAADVEPVVRCKDCKHYLGLAECEFEGHFSGGTNYFCADGERKTT